MSPIPPEAHPPADEAKPPKSTDEAPPAEYDEDVRLFYERLEQTGQLIDVDSNTDLTALPPRVTHIRYPDGTITRIGFSTSPYSE